MSEPIDLKSTAYHEAGHAVIAALQYTKKENSISHKQAVPFRYVTIRPKRPYKHNGIVYKVAGSVQLSPKYSTQANILVLTAGIFSQARIEPDGWLEQQKEALERSGSYSDIIKSEELGKLYQLSDEEYAELMDMCIDQVDQAWPAIEAVAQDLLEKGTVKRKEVVARCDEHGIKKCLWEI